MTGLPNDAWVLIADGEKALFLRNITDAENPNLEVVREEENDNPPTREQAANRPGRRSDGPSGHYSAMEDTDWHQLGKERFAADLAEILYKKAHANAFEKLVIAADPSVLGDLRGDLHEAVTSKIIAEIPKNYTNHPLDEIERLLKKELSEEAA